MKQAEFDRLVHGASKVHAATYCVKRAMPIPTINLKGRECVACKEFFENKGVCDPL